MNKTASMIADAVLEKLVSHVVTGSEKTALSEAFIRRALSNAEARGVNTVLRGRRAFQFKNMADSYNAQPDTDVGQKLMHDPRGSTEMRKLTAELEDIFYGDGPSSAAAARLSKLEATNPYAANVPRIPVPEGDVMG